MTLEIELHQLDLRYEALRRRSPNRERRIVASLADVGQQLPVIVLASSEIGRHVLLDGYKRVRALRQLGRDMVRATSWTLEESEALVLERILHTRADVSAIEQGWLLKELRDRFCLGLEELARRFDRTRSWVSRRLALVDALPEVIRHEILQGRIGAHAAMKYLVPLARANAEDCSVLARAVAPLHLTSREMSALYSAYISSSAPARALLINDPQLFLRAHELDNKPIPPERAPADQLLSDVGLLGAIARRILRQLRAGVAPKLRPREREEIARCVQQTQIDLEHALERLKKEILDARSEHASGDSAPR